MRIISKYKDYYDYYQGIFGVDNNKIYKRTNYIFYEKFNPTLRVYDFLLHTFAINNKIHFFFEDKAKMLYLTKDNLANLKLPYYTEKHVLEIISNADTDINRQKRQPIVYGRIVRGNKIVWQNGVPIMKSFGFQKVMSARKLYIEVESFMGYLKDNPPIPDKRTNKEKIITNGFDVKTSFRPGI